jgi:MYXO-CTERM domain-containing protein
MRRSSIGLLLAAFTLLFSVSGCGPEATSEDLASSTSEEIRGGEVDSGDLAVGLLFSHNGTRVTESCSGSLVAPNVILTAGHCFDTNVMDAFYVGQGVAVAGGDMDWQKATVNMRPYTIAQWARPPQYRRNTGFPPTVLDVAVGRLSQPITDIMPLPLATAAPPEGATGTIIGYGRHPTTGNQYDQHVKRTAMVTISQVLSTTLHQQSVTSGVPLGGDSGGPFIYNGSIAGTVCCGNGPALAQTEQWYARVDLAREWIVGMIGQYGGGDGGVVSGTGGAGGAGAGAGGRGGAGGSTGGSGGAATGGAATGGSAGSGAGSTITTSGGAGSGGAGGGGAGSTTSTGGSAGGPSSTSTTTTGTGPTGGSAPPPADSGCGCDVVGAPAASARAAAYALFVLALLGRRRRSALRVVRIGRSGKR